MKLKNLEDACSVISILIKPTPKFSLINITRKKTKDIIAGGDPVRVPVDRTAALVTSKAPWYFQPPQTLKIILKDKKNKFMQEFEPLSNTEKLSLASAVVSQIPTKHGQTIQKQQDLVDKAREAVEAITYLAENQQKAWFELEDILEAHMKSVRNKKGAIEIETRQIQSTIKYFNEFINDEKTTQAIIAAREFIEVINKLNELSESRIFNKIISAIS